MISWAAEERVLEAIARGETRVSACRAGPMSTKTLSRRLREPDFVARLDLKYAAVAGEIDRSLVALAGISTLVAAQLLRRDDEPQVQARMSLGLLGIWARRSGSDVESRLEELEAVARQQIERFERIVELCASDRVPELPWRPPAEGSA
jgi:hypothetical protein